MILTKPCEWCGELLTFDSNKMKGDDSPVIYIRTRRKSKLLFCRKCFNEIGASGAICLANID